jgi:23S rRNA pseudoU1915 N3-methylase RlmH
LRILVLSVGRPDRGPYGSLFEDYAARIRRFGTDFEARHVPEVEAGGRYADDHVREREARGLTAALPPRARVIALDPSGASLTSEQLAARLEAWATRSRPSSSAARWASTRRGAGRRPSCWRCRR